jgi:endonuclease/exonuclease/phosphatase family metal-dependent hydrolase
MARWLALLPVCLATIPALAADVPVAGKRLLLLDKAPAIRRAVVTLRDPAIAAPFPDPRAGLTTLAVDGGFEVGQCLVRVALDPSRWQPIGGDGAQRGYRYRHPTPGAQGVRRIVVKPGRITVTANGDGWPCDLAAAAEREPVSVTLRTAGGRYCAAFGGTTTNSTGRFEARGATAPPTCPDDDLTVADLNTLHGAACPAGTAFCRLTDRIDLLFQWIAASGCPDVVTLQEVWINSEPLIAARLGAVCPFTYHEVFIQTNFIDDEVILSRYPVLSSEAQRFYKNFRYVLHARLDHPFGPVDVFTTHLASGSDGAQNPCAADCPAECVAGAAATVRECQGLQFASYVAAHHDLPTPALVTGDFNVGPGTFVYDQLAGRGWVDSYLVAGNPECVPATGVGCTSGRVDNDLTQLESPASNESERIDYVFVVPSATGACTVDTPADADGDGTATGIFDADPNPFVPTCGPAPDAICWPSDHEGVQVDLNCG